MEVEGTPLLADLIDSVIVKSHSLDHLFSHCKNACQLFRSVLKLHGKPAHCGLQST